MALEYFLDACIDTYLNRESIEYILKKGAHLGMKYYAVNQGYDAFKRYNLDINEIVSKEFSHELENKLIPVQFKDTFFIMHFINDIIATRIIFTSLSPNWSKTFPDGTNDLDMARYIRLMLDLINDYKIRSFVAEKE